ncbi:hybrid sensor histidine kinase/response regulator [Sphingomonas sanxanigenens]|nr:ATP-binding protein [Sphingomonas sanxanigenens]AHA38083.1 two-component regulatory protein [Sphingomonas sanxanigenens]
MAPPPSDPARTAPFAERPGADGLTLAAVGAGALGSAALIGWAVGDWRLGAGMAALVIAGATLVWLFGRLHPSIPEEVVIADWALVRAAADAAGAAVAITDRAGRLVCASDMFGRWFPGLETPPGLPVDEAVVERLTAAGRSAWRDGAGAAAPFRHDGGAIGVDVQRAGAAEDHLVWRFSRSAGAHDLAGQARVLVGGEGGQRLGDAGVMAVIVDGEGRILAANPAFATRAERRADASLTGADFVPLLTADRGGSIRFAREGAQGVPLRMIQVPLGVEEGATLLLLIDDPAGGGANAGAASGHIQTLLTMLPMGLALADRDGRFLFFNEAFVQAAGIDPASPPLYPGDLVVREDKAAVADAVHRFASGRALSGDVAVRLAHLPDEPVALTIAGARSLGDAAVLLSLKDSSEESRLKRQVAQATKMQAVGQLAGGVAHDFNNVLTAIIGHCDLMLMRHTPGDSDYDDIQQIKANSNRAASLTRQLLAFSRQQTLRPQTLQLPDTISEVSNLLKRLLGETVTLVVKHGRDLGPVRADPGQLEQVIVNLAVNARDAMLPRGGGTLTIQTFAVSAAEVRRMATDMLPVADYTAFSVADTGTGIPPEILPKIFEPFFTTKEVGKGTGLGLSTVYGIVKQSGGSIFADSRPGQGTEFVIYLPVHRVEAGGDARQAPRQRLGELWGSGTVLLVEDEEMVRSVTERALARHGYTVLTAENGEEALEILDRGDPIDLLISDVVMPAMDGPTLVNHARRRMPDLPILFMSGYAEEQLRRSIDIANVGFLAKPFSMQQLAEATRERLGA